MFFARMYLLRTFYWMNDILCWCAPTLEVVFSPSRRTASSLLTDWESEPDGLKVCINRTEHEPLMKHLKALDEANANIQWIRKCPSLGPVFARNTFAERAGGTGGMNGVSPVSLPFLRTVTHLIYYMAKITRKWSVKMHDFGPKSLQTAKIFSTFAVGNWNHG